MNLETDIKRAVELIRGARHMIAFTGAGHSTPSGIPDFRSPTSGLWERDNPMLVASIWAFRLNPKGFFNWVRPLIDQVLSAVPNPAHLALAALEEMGYLQAVVTQNIDNLHQAAGSRRVLELHGNMQGATCIRCYAQVAAGPLIESFRTTGRIPYCPCGGVLKPNVILFGEQLPVRVLNEAMDEARCCDLVLVAGSSLEVTPAADIPFLAVKTGARGIIVNYEPTAFDHIADVVIHGDVAKILPRILDQLQADGRPAPGA